MPSVIHARSSQICAIERRAGVSMTEVVIDDMVTVNPVPSVGLAFSAFGRRFPKPI
jgi:hypothetical protein